MADSNKQFTAENRIPSRPLSYEFRDLAQPKELLVDYDKGLIYVVTAQKTFINITDAIKEQISMDADSVRAVEIELDDGTTVTLESGMIQALSEIDSLKTTTSELSTAKDDHEKRIKSLESGSASDERVEAINQQLEAMSTAVNEHTTKIGALETEVDEAASAASTAQNTANAAKSTADANKTSITSEITQRKNADTALQESIDAVSDEVSTLAGTVDTNKTELENKNTELANSISSLSDTVTANKNSLDNKNTSQDQAIQALQSYNEKGILILNATISADTNDWSDTDGDAPYKQTITLEGILETDYPIVDINLSDDYGTAVDELESYGRIMKILTFDGYIEVYATEPTSVALNIFMKTDRKSTN